MYSVFVQLCEKQGLSPTTVGRLCGIAASSISDWKSGRSEPKADKLKKIADYFHVSVDYLMTGELPENGTYYTDEESRELANFLFENPQYKTLFSAARNVRPEDLRMVQEILDRFAKPSYPDDPA